MSVSRTLNEYLEDNNYHYQVLVHAQTNTAQENGRILSWPSHRVAKVIACKADSVPTLLVLPATEKVHIRTLQESLNVIHVHLLTEDEMCEIFPECEVGAQTPFASLYGMNLVVSEHFDKDKEVIFNAENHHEVLRIPMVELIKTENAKIVNFSVNEEDYDEYKSLYYTWG